MIPGLPLGPHPCNPFALVASPKLRLRHMLSKYGMVGCKPISIPLNQNGKLSADAGEFLEDATMYKKIVGSFIYMTITRPDLNYIVGLESQFM